MKKIKVFSVFSFIILLSTCEKQENLYIPKIECRSDWLTNQYYHQPVVSPEISELKPDFSVNIEGVAWKPDRLQACYGTDGKRRITASGSYHFYIALAAEESLITDCFIVKYGTSSTEIPDVKINMYDFNPGTKVLNMDFSVKAVHHFTYPVVYDDTVEYSNCRVRNLRFHDFYERTEYKLSSGDSILHGTWRLIEIADCATGRIYYPPYFWTYWINIDTAKYLNPPDPRYYFYDYPMEVYGRNTHSLSYEFINDTTIVTSGGGATQVGMAKEDGEYYYMLCRLIDYNSITLKKYKNLLELRTQENVYLRFFK